jgi:PhnB protein
VKEIVAYLNFDGQAREAMEFYKKCLGGELFLMTYADAPGDSPPDLKDRIIHACLTTAAGKLMSSDTMPGMPTQAGNNFWVCLQCDSLEEIERVFAALAEGGKVESPLDNMFWGARFGTLADRFGVNWMFNYELPKQA